MSTVPIFTIHRSCDSAVACNNAQRVKFSQPPGYDHAGWVTALEERIGDPAVTRVIIDDRGDSRGTCVAAADCGFFDGLENHLRWPDGVADGGGADWELDLLEFLRDHPLP